MAAEPQAPPAASRATQGPPAKRLASEATIHPGLHWPLAIASAVAALMAVHYAYDALDRPDPEATVATTYYALAFVFGGIGVGLGVFSTLKDQWRAPWFAFIGAPLVAWVLVPLITDYGEFLSGLGLALFTVYVAPAILLGTLIWMLIEGIVRGWGHAGASAAAFTFILPAGIALASAFMLATMPDQVEAARRSHESPAAGLVLLGVLLFMTIRSR